MLYNYSSINDTRIKYNNILPINTYHKFCKNYYSQNGEDGILEQLLKELDIKNGYCCEFGASDGITSSNTYNLIKNHNFKGIQIEANRESYNKLLNTYKNYPQVACYNDFVSNHNLPSFLKITNFPVNFDILSIDIDSNDYHIWKNFNEYEPKIVIIEVNSYRDPIVEELPTIRTNDYTIANDPLYKWHKPRIGEGTSYIKMIELGLEKGYIPVSFTGNITFVHKNYIDQLKEFPYIVSTNKFDYLYLYTNLSMWNNEWYTNTGLIFNTSIRNYYLEFKDKNINFDWVFENMNKNKELVWKN